jgi:osmoprotectant transport system substrate-binding protein
VVLTGCGESGSSGTKPKAEPSKSVDSATTTCEPVAGDQLVALDDDKALQTVDNVIPAVHAQIATPDFLAVLDKVSAALTTEKLIGLNKKTDVERMTPAKVAKDFFEAEGIGGELFTEAGTTKVVVGAANFSENQTLANLYAEALKAAGFQPTVKTVGNRELYEPALEKGELQVVPEYAGTLTEFLNKKQNGKAAPPVASGDLEATVQALTTLGEKANLKFGKPSEAADQNAFAVTREFADKYGVRTLSELASKCPSGLTLGGPPECPERPFCQPGLEEKYSLEFDSFKALDPGGPLSKTALRQGQVAVALVFSSDAALATG